MTARGGKRGFFLVLCLLGVLLFIALGIWQLERRAWKRGLIDRVEAHLGAPPVDLPGREAWPMLATRDQEYRRIRARGVFRHDRATLVEALTERGAGFWVVTPLRTGEGVLLVNRGFVPKENRDGASLQQGEVTVTGLLRLSEPQGRFLRPNRPQEERWYSRDVAAIAAARRLEGTAPFFIDADASPSHNTLPVGGLTVIRFPNNHFIYAVTWFGLAGLCLAGLVLLVFPAHRRR